jgi:flagellar basal body-associated protein FliL
MGINVKSKLRGSSKFLLLTTLIVVLFASCFGSIFSNVSPFVSGDPDKTVSNEVELKNAVNSAPFKEYTIALNNDITLTEALRIPVDKDITLTSNKAGGYYKLIGAEGASTIFVDGGGVLRLDGIIVTHVKNAGPVGGGVYVEANGQLIMHGGEISGNIVIDYGDPRTPTAHGGGVFNRGVFELYGGKISENGVTCMGSKGGGSGGGVRNVGTFTMFDGEISNNNAQVSGGGVYNTGTFTMSGGKITNNSAVYWGGGVSNFGVFERLGGVISDNTADASGSDNVHPDDVSGGSSNGSGGSGSGNGDGSGGSGGGSSGGNDKLSVWVVVVIVVVVVSVVVVGCMFFYFKKKVAQIEAKFNTISQDKLEM